MIIDKLPFWEFFGIFWIIIDLDFAKIGRIYFEIDLQIYLWKQFWNKDSFK